MGSLGTHECFMYIMVFMHKSGPMEAKFWCPDSVVRILKKGSGLSLQPYFTIYIDPITLD